MRIDGDTSELELRTAAVELNERRTGGLVLGAGLDGVEAIWTTLRLAGVPEDRINFSEFELPPRAPFEVSVPVRAHVDVSAGRCP